MTLRIKAAVVVIEDSLILEDAGHVEYTTGGGNCSP